MSSIFKKFLQQYKYIVFSKLHLKMVYSGFYKAVKL
jgi:hypothetical protein